MLLRNYKYSLYGFLVFYFLAALSAGLTESGEFFPLFSGHWFYQTPVEFNDYGMLIGSLDGADLENPVYLEKIYPQFPVWPFAAYGAVQRWGRSVDLERTDRDAQGNSAQKLIFGQRKFKAQLVKRRFNSLDFVKTGLVENAKVLMHVEN